MNVVDKIYELINKDNSINTFNDNLDLFQEFYYHNMMIRYNGPKVIEIYKYLLSLNISEDHEKFPYINSKILEDFNRYELIITQSVYNKSEQIDDNFVDMLYKLINEYNQFKLYENQGSLTKLLDENHFIRDYTGSMMVILNSSFFKLSNENIKKMMDSIKNNSYLQNVVEEGKMGKQLLDIDYIFQYTTRFLFNAHFINEENLNNDLLLNSIKNSRIKDRNTLKKIFKNVDIYVLLSCFENKLSPIIDMLEQSFEDEFYKIELFKIIYNKLIDENEYGQLMQFIINDNRHNNYIIKEENDFIINEFCCHYPTNITEDEIEYILNHKYNKLFLINLKEDYKNNNWSEKTKKNVQKLTNYIEDFDYDLKTSLETFELLFKGDKEVNIAMIISSLKRLIKDYLNDENIKIHIIKDDSINGCASKSENCIELNYDLIKKLLVTSDYETAPESIHILETIFHEARHIQQFTYMQDENMEDDIYMHYKEEVVSNINLQYYQKNYFGISFEKDARVTGSKMVVSLLKNYFPHMKECIKYYENKVDEELREDVKTKYIFELSEELNLDEVLEKIVTINPDIIKQYPGLKREYNLDGSKINSEQKDRKSI